VSGAYVAEAVRRRVAEAAARRCGYCQTQEEIVGYTLHIEHILPLAAGGTSNEENLWLGVLRLQQCERDADARTGSRDGR
jgi:5-methylcytosine-specific restriction endonuclease McrA